MKKQSIGTDAIELLKKDHAKVKGLFRQFENTDSDSRKQKITDKVIEELEIHTKVEEEIFYPAVRKIFKNSEELRDLMDESYEEHHEVKFVMSELKKMKAGQKHYDAKFTVLSENVKHHILEEHQDMFPEVRAKRELDLKALGKKMKERKLELQKA